VPESHTPKRVVILRGTMCSGKTTLENMMQRGDMHLCDCEILREAVADGYYYAMVNEIDAMLQAGTDFRELADRHPAHTLVVDSCVHAQAIAEAFADTEVVQVCLVAPWYIIAARRRLRMILMGTKPAAVEADPHYARYAMEYAGPNYAQELAVAGTDLIFVNTADYPWKVIEASELQAMLNPLFAWPLIEDPTQLYQQTLRIWKHWYGNIGRVPFEEARQNVVLPECCDGMSVMDVGGSEGGFCFEAINRGATYALNVEIREPQLALARTIRDGMRQPLSVANINVDEHGLPSLNDFDGATRRWDLTLMLNILHRVKDPEKTFRQALAISREVVVEAPFCIGEEPRKGVEGSKYPETTHLPPLWIQTIAESMRFELSSIALGPYVPQQRLVYHLKWRNGNNGYS